MAMCVEVVGLASDVITGVGPPVEGGLGTPGLHAAQGKQEGGSDRGLALAVTSMALQHLVGRGEQAYDAVLGHVALPGHLVLHPVVHQLHAGHKVLGVVAWVGHQKVGLELLYELIVGRDQALRLGQVALQLAGEDGEVGEEGQHEGGNEPARQLHAASKEPGSSR